MDEMKNQKRKNVFGEMKVEIQDNKTYGKQFKS